ncbi:hypothetical protein [Streptomyces nitrosporeus]|uniref:hypothetical protein n=1 Tax=Streptomyces nitrosporeus TaxID=28894 RepID=UPI00123CF3AA|nr:hypothetical protein [Streptomyces nitrosporeus]
MTRPSLCPPELHEHAARVVAETGPDHRNEWAETRTVAAEPGTGAAWTVRAGVREGGAGRRPGDTPEEAEEIKWLGAGGAELRGADGILEAASASFVAGFGRLSKRS